MTARGDSERVAAYFAQVFAHETGIRNLDVQAIQRLLLVAGQAINALASAPQVDVTLAFAGPGVGQRFVKLAFTRTQLAELVETRDPQSNRSNEAGRQGAEQAGRLTPALALEMFGLPTGATADDIRDAYTRLIKRLHPDAGGSEFFAKQLNAARDLLLP